MRFRVGMELVRESAEDIKRPVIKCAVRLYGLAMLRIATLPIVSLVT